MRTQDWGGGAALCWWPWSLVGPRGWGPGEQGWELLREKRPTWSGWLSVFSHFPCWGMIVVLYCPPSKTENVLLFILFSLALPAILPVYLTVWVVPCASLVLFLKSFAGCLVCSYTPLSLPFWWSHRSHTCALCLAVSSQGYNNICIPQTVTLV